MVLLILTLNVVLHAKSLNKCQDNSELDYNFDNLQQTAHLSCVYYKFSHF